MADFLEGVVASGLQIGPCLRLAVVAHQMNQIAVILFSSKVITVSSILVASVCHLMMRVVMRVVNERLLLHLGREMICLQLPFIRR